MSARRPTVWMDTVAANLRRGDAWLDDVALDNLALLQDRVPGVETWAFTMAEADGAIVAARGPVRPFGLPEQSASLTLEGSDDTWHGHLDCALPSSAVALPFLEQARLIDAQLHVAMGGTGEALLMAEPTLVVTIAVRGQQHTLRIASSTDTIDVWVENQTFDLAALSGLLEASGLGSLLAELPVDQLRGEIELTTLALALRAGTFVPAAVELGLRVPEVATPFDGVTLASFAVSLQGQSLTDAARRRVSMGASATLRIGGTAIALSGELPQFRFRGALDNESGVSLASLYRGLAGSAPPDLLPALSIRQLSVDADWPGKRLQAMSTLEGDWPIPGTNATLQGLQLDLELSADNPGARLYATTVVGGERVAVRGAIGRDTELAGSLRPTTLVALLARFDVTAPPELPEIAFGSTAREISGSQGVLRLQSSVTVHADLFDTGSPTALTCRLQLALRAGKPPIAELAVSADGPIAIDTALVLGGVELSFNLGADGAWVVAGDLEASLFDRPVALRASYEQSGQGSALRLSVTTPVQVALVPDVATLWLEQVAMVVSRVGKQRSTALQALGALELPDLMTYQAQVSLSANGIQLTPNPDAGDQAVRLPLSIDPDQPEAAATVVSLLSVGFARSGREAPWQVTADARVHFEGVPFPVSVLLPETEVRATLQLGAHEIALQLESDGLQSLALDIGSDAIPAPDVSVRAIGIRRRSGAGNTWQLGADLRVDALDRLNRLLGGADVFVERLDLALVVDGGVRVQPKTSPFRAIALRTLPDGSLWTEWHQFEGIGTLSFLVPELTFDFKGGRWRASGGVLSSDGLSLPLTPVRWLARKCGLPDALLNKMPDCIPLRELDLASPEVVPQLLDMLGTPSKAVTAAFEKLADALAQGIDNLPADFEDYLQLHIPTNFRFDLAIEPGGGAHVTVGVEDDKPIRVIMPTVAGVPPLPALMGVTLYEVGFGVSSGGALGVVRFDGWIDRLDIVNLVFALLSGKGEAITNRVTLRKLVALVPMAAPVPMPLFYDELGWRYRNFLGLGMQLQAAFPDPEPSLGDWVRLVVSLVRFFTDDQVFLHQDDNLPDSLALPFTLGPATLSLPNYLGGARSGIDRALPPLEMADTLAHGIDGIKAGNAGWLIRTVPLSYREGRATKWPRISDIDMAFGPLSFRAVCCVTTDAEFRNVVMKSKSAMRKLAKADPVAMIGCTPVNMGGAPYDKGYLVLMMGEAAIKVGRVNLIRSKTQFGMALTGPGNRQLAVRQTLQIGPEGLLAVRINGLVKTRRVRDDSDKVAVNVAGEIALQIARKTFALGGSLKVVPGELFEARIRLVLADDFWLQGTLKIDAGGLAISGTVVWDTPGRDRIEVRTSAVASADGLMFKPAELKVGDLSATMFLSLPGKRNSLFNAGFELELPKGFSASFRKGLKSVANKAVGNEVSDGYNMLISAIKKKDSFEASLRGVRRNIPPVCAEVKRRIASKTSKRSVHAMMDSWAGKHVGRKLIVAGAKPFAPKEAREAAEPWIDKLTAVQNAAKAKIDRRYRTNLKRALKALIRENVAEIRLGEFKGFPGILLYRHKPVLSKTQVKLVKQAIEAIDELPAATKQRLSAERVLKSMPKNQQVLADVRRSVDEGIDSGIPNIRSVRFEKSVRPLLPDDVALRVEIAYKGRVRVLSIAVNLMQAGKLPKQIAEAFARSLKK